MGNLCENRLRATGTEEQTNLLARHIKKTYETVNFEADFINDEAFWQLDLYFNSSSSFPKAHFLEITSSIPDTTGLFIRVASDEPATNYLEQSIFRNGSWSFENPPSINTQIHELTSKGLDNIRKILAANGNRIKLNDDSTFMVLYTNVDGDPASGFLKAIKLGLNYKIKLVLSNGALLVEDEITTNHVLDIFSIIDDKNGIYIKPTL